MCICEFGYRSMHVSAGAHGDQGHYITLELGLRVFMGCLTWVLELNSGPLQEQRAHTLTAEPSLSPQPIFKPHEILLS